MNETSEIRIQPSYSRWLTEEVFNLIDLVRNDEAIYNPRHKYYFCRPYVENFWREIDLRLRKNSGSSLAKWTNLRISFRREYANFQEEKATPCWSYFDRMLFLHPYLRNKKTSETPKGIDPHLQEALAQINSLNYKSQHQTTSTTPTTSESPVNEYMDQYLSYCEDDPQPLPDEELDDIIEEENQTNSHNPISNDVKPESDNEVEDKDDIQIQEHDDFKDIIIEIADDDTSNPSQNELKQLSPQNDCAANRTSSSSSLVKRPRIELSNIANPSSNNVSLVRPLTSALHPPAAEVNLFHQAMMASSSQAITSNRGEIGSPTSAPTSSSSALRRNEFCECKTDSDAMFLMSLLPDIRKLNGRDRGKIKIAFQNIVQEFLYPE